MSGLDELFKEAGETALDSLKSSFSSLLSEAKGDSNEVIKETGEKIEQWLKLRAEGEIDDDELEALLTARKRTVEQFINQQEVSSRSSLERISTDLIDTIKEKLNS